MTRTKMPDPYPVSIRYSVAGLAAILSLVLTSSVMVSAGGLHSAFMLTAVVISAWYGGFGPGIFCLALTLIPQVLLRAPVGRFTLHGRHEWVGLVAYVLNSLVISSLFKKRFLMRKWNAVSPATVTGGWWWRLDASGNGVVEVNSPAFPHLHVARKYDAWLLSVHENDRERVDFAIKDALQLGEIDIIFHMQNMEGEVRQITMFGVRSAENLEEIRAVCLESESSVVDPQSFLG